MCPPSFECVYVCLNRSICSRACSSIVSFRLDSISAIPLTFSTKRLQEKTRALTQDAQNTHTCTHILQAHVYSCAYKKRKHTFADLNVPVYSQRHISLKVCSHWSHQLCSLSMKSLHKFLSPFPLEVNWLNF